MRTMAIRVASRPSTWPSASTPRHARAYARAVCGAFSRLVSTMRERPRSVQRCRRLRRVGLMKSRRSWREATRGRAGAGARAVRFLRSKWESGAASSRSLAGAGGAATARALAGSRLSLRLSAHPPWPRASTGPYAQRRAHRACTDRDRTTRRQIEQLKNWCVPSSPRLPRRRPAHTTCTCPTQSAHL